MIQVHPARRAWSVSVRSLSLLVLVLAASGAFAAQTCKYDSIAATAPASRFTDNGDGTVTDQTTGLQWKRCSEGQTWAGGTCTGALGVYTWQQALQRADSAGFAGRNDWRLPNIKELTSIVEEACSNPSIDLTVFPGMPSPTYPPSTPTTIPGGYAGSYWSSTPDDGAWVWVWSVGFGAEGIISSDHITDVRLVRLVRAGQ